MDTFALDLPTQPAEKPGILLKRLKQNHPRLDLNRVKILHALYRGGRYLLGDDNVLQQVMPKYAHEKALVYDERRKRAFYENIFAQVINQISAGLAQDPIRILQEIETIEEKPDDDEQVAKPPTPGENPFAKKDDEEKPDPKKDPKSEDAPDKKPPFPPKPPVPPSPFGGPPQPPKPTIKLVEEKIDDYWHDLIENATALSEDGSTHRSLDQVIRDVAVEALVTGWGWLQADLPKPDDELPTSLAEQEESGALRAYLVPWSTERVTDWEEHDGRILWVRTYSCEVRADDPSALRDTKKHVWTIWDDKTWTRYELIEKRNQQMPNDETPIMPASSGDHTFGRVPWVRLDLCLEDSAHLHIGDIIESLCRNYFNRQNGESFQWTQFYYQQLYEFLGPEIAGIDTMVSEAQTDTNRAKRVRAPGEVHVRGAEDRAEFVGPNMAGAEAGRNALQDIRDAILRIVAQMALAQDTSGAMIRRSGDSKRQDSVAQEIVLGAIGKKLVTLANHTVELLADGRGDTEEPPKMVGYQHFDVTDADTIVNRGVLVETLDIPSATYQIERKWQIAVADLGESIDSETKRKIKEELSQSITQDQLTAPEIPPGFGEPPFGADPNAPPKDGQPPPFGAKPGAPPFGQKPGAKPPFGKKPPFGASGPKKPFPPKKPMGRKFP